MGRHPQTESIASAEHSKRIPTARDFALCDLFAVAITRRTAAKREDTRSSSKLNTSVSERMKVHPEKLELHAVAPIRRSTEIEKPSSENYSKQEKLPLCSTYRAVLPHQLRPPTPYPEQREQDTLSPSAQASGLETPIVECTSSYQANGQPLKGPTDNILQVFGTLINQLHTIRSSLNVSKREYGRIKSHHYKALRVFCTGRCEGWAKEESKISRRISSVSRALREDRESEQQIVDKLEELESVLNERGCSVDRWRRPSGLERWTPD